MRYLQIRIAVPENVPAERAILYTFAEMMRDVHMLRDPSRVNKYRSVVGLREGNVQATAAWVKLPKAVNA
jgi:hypothetical protein